MDSDQRLWEAILKQIKILKNELKTSNGDRAREVADDRLQKYLGNSLRMVTKKNNLVLVKKLIEEQNADPNDADTEGNNSIMIAVAGGRVNVLEYFLSDDVNINAQNRTGATALHLACGDGREEVVRILMGSPQLDINKTNIGMMTPLFIACHMGHEAVVSMLLGHSDIQVNKGAINMDTPFMAACATGHPGVVRLLLTRNDLDINAKNIDQNTALFYACEHNHEAIVSTLLGQEDIQVNEANVERTTPLVQACRGGHLGVVKMLLTRDDLDVNASNKYNFTALMISCGKGHIEIVRCLLDHEDIDVNIELSKNMTALALACEKDRDEIISILLQREDLHKTTRNLDVITYHVMNGRVKKKDVGVVLFKKRDMGAVIERAVNRNLPDIAVWLLKWEGSRNFGLNFYQCLLAKAVKHCQVGLVEYLNDQRLADDVSHLDINQNTEEILSAINGDVKKVSTPENKIKKKRKKNRPSETQLNQNQDKSDSISEGEDVSLASEVQLSNPDDPSPLEGSAFEAREASFDTEKFSKTEQMKNSKEEPSDRNQGQVEDFEVSQEFDVDTLGEAAGDLCDITLKKAEYRDKAKEELENKMKDLSNLQKDNEKLQKRIRDKEKEFDSHKDKVTEMIDQQGKTMTEYISAISRSEDEKAENGKEIKKLEAQIDQINERQRECDAKIEKMERKRKGLEKFIESEMCKMKAEGAAITEEIERLNEALRSNIKATEDLARMDNASEPVARLGGDANSRMIDFLSKSIKEKEADLECPVCMETAEVPIFTCQEMHLICAHCRPQLRECPECRAPYPAQPRRHRFAEKTAEELKKLREELAELTKPEI